MDIKNQVFKAGETGASDNNLGRITMIEKLKFKAGRQDPDYKEFVFDGEYLNGHWILDRSGVNKQWVMSRPKKKNFDDINLNKEIPIIKREEKRRLIFGVVYEPNVVDAHGDNTTPDELQKAAHKFLERHNSINFMHETKINQHAKVVESFIAPITYRENGQTIKKGSWVMALHILNEKIWGMIMKGEINAFSIEGTAKAGKPNPQLENK